MVKKESICQIPGFSYDEAPFPDIPKPKQWTNHVMEKAYLEQMNLQEVLPEVLVEEQTDGQQLPDYILEASWD